jgi:hypothetical protein
MWLIFIVTGIGVDFSIPRFFQTEGTLVEENKVLQEKKEEAKRDWTWKLSLPAGGIGGGWAGGVLGTVAGFGIGYAMDPGKDVIIEGCMPTFVGTMVGWTLGTSLGIWLTGKYIEKEEGSFGKTLLGTTIGSIISIPLHFWVVKSIAEMPPSPVLSLGIVIFPPIPISCHPYSIFSLTGGIIGFNLSL